MRRARARDHWRRAVSGKSGFGLISARVRGIPPLDDVATSFAPGLTVLCGLNGVGKTSFLRVVEAALGDSTAAALRSRPGLLDLGAADITVCFDNEDRLFSLSSADPADMAPVAVIDSTDSTGFLVAIRRQENFSDLLEVVEPRLWTEKERSTAAYVVGRPYESIIVSEVENPTTLDQGFSEAMVPFFQVSALGVDYDSFAMGVGEHAVLTTLWHLWRCEPQTVVILEEPETFLSSRSTAALLDVLAEEVARRRLCALVTTHSPDVVASTPIENIRLIRHVLDSPSVIIEEPSSRPQLEHALGALSGQQRLVFTEDRTAQLVTQELLAIFAGVWGDGAEVQIAGDAQSVTSLCKILPTSDGIRAAGILDGDQSAPSPADTNWPVLVLPGAGDPDTVLRAAALADQARLASELRRDPASVALALASIGGSDAHDWFPDLATALGLGTEVAVRAACHCWLDDAEVRLQAESFVRSLSDALTL